MRTVWNFFSAGQLLFGQNAASRIGEIATGAGRHRALIITDRNLVKAGVIDPVRESLQGAGVAVEVWDGGEPEPSMDAALACSARAREIGADVLVAVGGGSNLDLGKITAVLVAHGGHPRDYVGEFKVPGPITPLIAVPTTAGTGSEVSAASVLSDKEKGTKVGVLSNYLRPFAAVVDPLLTLSCPPSVTADSGIDALTHALEAYTAVDNEEFPLPASERSVYQGRNPLTRALAEEAVRRVGRHLTTAVHEGSNVEAREGMLLGSLLAGLAFSNSGVALVHALEYPLGGAVHTPHGRGNGLLLPYVMEYNKPARVETLARAAAVLGVDTTGMADEAAADAAIETVRRLRRESGIPDRLRDVGCKEEQLRGFAEMAICFVRILRVNPRQPTVDELEQIFRNAY